jgi:dTDP-4-amino-4,6-dideoxygalactose transaminase
VEKRDELQKFLSESNIMTKKYFLPIHHMDAYREYKDLLLPNTDYLAKHCLCLPIFSHMSEDTIDMICEKIIQFFKK